MKKKRKKEKSQIRKSRHVNYIQGITLTMVANLPRINSSDIKYKYYTPVLTPIWLFNLLFFHFCMTTLLQLGVNTSVLIKSLFGNRVNSSNELQQLHLPFMIRYERSGIVLLP